MIKIKYKKSRFRYNLVFGIIWIGLGIFSLVGKDKIIWTDYGYLIVGILYLGLYLYEMTNQYITINHETIKRNSLFGKEIKVKDINRIKKVYGQYTLITRTQQLKINTDFIDSASLDQLNKFLVGLNIEVVRTP